MDDFNGKFCKNGSFPVIRAVRDCFKKAMVKTTTTTTTTTSSKKSKTTQQNYYPYRPELKNDSFINQIMVQRILLYTCVGYFLKKISIAI